MAALIVRPLVKRQQIRIHVNILNMECISGDDIVFAGVFECEALRTGIQNECLVTLANIVPQAVRQVQAFARRYYQVNERHFGFFNRVSRAIAASVPVIDTIGRLEIWFSGNCRDTPHIWRSSQANRR
jgi:hypothetical protein